MTGTEKSDRSGGPSCEARTDRYVILDKGQIACEDGDGNDVFTAAQAEALLKEWGHLNLTGKDYTAHRIDPVPTVFETREEKLERLVEVVLEQGQLHASWLAAELLASREATLTPEQIKRFEGAADRGLSANREKNLLTLLTNVTVAADRLIQQWAESDDDVKHALWKSLGSAVQAAEETVYPLPSEAGPAERAATMSEGRYVIFSGAGVLVSGPWTLGVSLRELDNIKALPITYPNFPYTIHAVGPALTVGSPHHPCRRPRSHV